MVVADGRVGEARLARGPRRELVRVGKIRRESGGRTAISRAVRGTPSQRLGSPPRRVLEARCGQQSRQPGGVSRRGRGKPPCPAYAVLRDVRAAFGQQLPQQRLVASRLVGAIAADGHVRPVRQRRDEVEHLARRRNENIDDSGRGRHGGRPSLASEAKW